MTATWKPRTPRATAIVSARARSAWAAAARASSFCPRRFRICWGRSDNLYRRVARLDDVLFRGGEAAPGVQAHFDKLERAFGGVDKDRRSDDQAERIIPGFSSVCGAGAVGVAVSSMRIEAIDDDRHGSAKGSVGTALRLPSRILKWMHGLPERSNTPLETSTTSSHRTEKNIRLR